MYCRNCGKPLPEDARFCQYCGTEVPDLEILLAAAGRSPAEEAPVEEEETSGTQMPAAFGDKTVVLSQEELQQFGQQATVYNADMPQGVNSRAGRQTAGSARAYEPSQTEEESAPWETAASPRAYVPEDAEETPSAGGSVRAQAGPPERSPKEKKVLIAVAAAAIVSLVILSAVVTVLLLGGEQEETVSAAQQAQAAYNAGEYDEAVTLLEDWLENETGTAAEYRLLAQCYEALGDLDSAAQAYADGYAATGQQSLAVSAVDLWLQLAQQADEETAAEYYAKVLTLDPDNAQALLATQDDSAQTEASAEPSAEGTEEADEFPVVEEDSETTQEDSLTQSEQAQAFYDEGDYNGAEVILYTMRRAGTLTAEDYALYGLVLQAQDRSDAAVTMYYEGYVETQDLSLLESGTALALELAQSAIDDGDYEVAQVWYERILDYDTDNAAATEGLETVEELLNPPEPVYETVYTVVSGTYTWEEAAAEAEARGGQLAVISDEETYEAITDLLGDTLLSVVWVGARTDVAGQWEDAKWVDGSDVTYTRWYSGEPNGDDGEGYYLGLFLVNGEWYYNDFPNDLSEYYESIGFVMESQVEVTQ